MGVVEEVANGTELVGEVGITGIFESKFKPADITVSELKQAASKDGHAMFNSARSSGDDEIDYAVLEKTQEEVQNGWAFGPIELDKLPSHAVLSRRFGLKQPGKIRLIDDLSGSLVNSTVQTMNLPNHTLPMLSQPCHSRCSGVATKTSWGGLTTSSPPKSNWPSALSRCGHHSLSSSTLKLASLSCI